MSARLKIIIIAGSFVLAIHRRFREEGIEINYPMRVIVPAGSGNGKIPADLA